MTGSAPDNWKLVAYLCIGWLREKSTIPKLEKAGWEKRGRLADYYSTL